MHTSSNSAPPVFVLSPPRSYTTVTTALLGAHPRIFAFPELLLFPKRSLSELLDEGTHWEDVPDSYFHNRVSGVHRAVAQLRHGDQSADAIEDARAWLAGKRSWSTVDLMTYLLGLLGDRLAVEKSPDTVLSDAGLRDCMESFPDARFIHLTRHPVTTLRSMIRNLMAIRPRPLRVAAVRAASDWYLAHGRALDALERVPASRWRRVRAEDVLHRPRERLPEIVGWLGLTTGESELERMCDPQNWVFANTGSDGTLRGGDALFFLSPALRPVEPPGHLELPASWEIPAEMAERMSALAERLGYLPLRSATVQ